MADTSSISAIGSRSQTGNTISIGLQPGLTATSTGIAKTGTVVGAKQGAQAVSKALANATSAFAALSDLQARVKEASSGSASLTAAQAKTLNDKIKSVATQIDSLSAGAKVGNANLLTKGSGAITVLTQSGNAVKIATQDLTSKSLGLSDIKVTDADSLRSAVGKIAQAVGQTQLTAFRLQTADGATSLTATSTNAGLSAYDKIFANIDSTPTAGSAADSLARALASQIAANSTSYSSSGSLSSSSSSSSYSSVSNVLSVLA